MKESFRSKILENLINVKTTNNVLLFNNKNKNKNLLDEIMKQRIERTKKKYIINQTFNTKIIRKKGDNNNQRFKSVNESTNTNKKRNTSASVYNNIYLTEANFHQNKKINNSNKVISLYDNLITDIERENKIMNDIKNSKNRKIYSSTPYKDDSKYYFIDIKNEINNNKFIKKNISKNLVKKINKVQILDEIKDLNHQKLMVLSPENIMRTKKITERMNNNIKFYKKNLIDLFHNRNVWDKEYQQRYNKKQINLSEINSYSDKYRKEMKFFKISPSFVCRKNSKNYVPKNINYDLFNELLNPVSIKFKNC